MAITTSVSIEVLAYPDYHYSATASEDHFSLRYLEGPQRQVKREICFASAEEMTAVAEAMLKTVRTFGAP